MPKPQDSVTPQALRNQLRAHLERLAAEVDAMRQSDGFHAALCNMAKLWQYSFQNQFFILMQRPGATCVRGRQDWAARGRKVKKGERPIAIFAPSRGRGGDVGYFVTVGVYDVAQTRGRRFATLDLMLRGRTRHVRTLERAAAALGIEVVYEVTPPGTGGLSRGGLIQVDPRLLGRERAAKLAHELAHEVLHQAERRKAIEAKRQPPTRTRAEVETEADGTAYVVLLALGLPSKAPAYIAWQGGDGRGVLRSMTRCRGRRR